MRSCAAAGAVPGAHAGNPERNVFERLWMQPALTVIGFDSHPIAGSSNQIVAAATARLSFRLAPGQDPERVARTVAAHVDTHVPFGLRPTVTVHEAVPAWTCEPDGPAFSACVRALTEGFGTEPVLMGMGGSVPFVGPFVSAFAHDGVPIPALLIGPEDPRSHAHGEDESLHLDDWRKLIESEMHLIADSRSELASTLPTACQPHMPWAPGPGGVDAEHRYTPSAGVRYGSRRATGRNNNWRRSSAPAEKSPPCRFASCCSSSTGPSTRACRDYVLEAGRGRCDLALDGRDRILERGTGEVDALRHVAIGPERVPMVGCTARVGDAGLAAQHEGPLGHHPAGHELLGRGDLQQRAAEVDRAGPAARGIRPRHGLVQRVVDLAGAGTGPEAQQRAAVATWEALAGEVDELARAHVEQHSAGRRKLLECGYLGAGLDLAPALEHDRGKRVGDALRAAPGDRPADHHARGTEE